MGPSAPWAPGDSARIRDRGTLQNVITLGALHVPGCLAGRIALGRERSAPAGRMEASGRSTQQGAHRSGVSKRWEKVCEDAQRPHGSSSCDCSREDQRLPLATAQRRSDCSGPAGCLEFCRLGCGGRLRLRRRCARARPAFWAGPALAALTLACSAVALSSSSHSESTLDHIHVRRACRGSPHAGAGLNSPHARDRSRPPPPA
jgi:hypothetical protein